MLRHRLSPRPLLPSRSEPELLTSRGGNPPSLSLFLTPLQKSAKQNLIVVCGRRQARRLDLVDQRRRSFKSRRRSGRTRKSRSDEREKRYARETQSIHIRAPRAVT